MKWASCSCFLSLEWLARLQRLPKQTAIHRFNRAIDFTRWFLAEHSPYPEMISLVLVLWTQETQRASFGPLHLQFTGLHLMIQFHVTNPLPQGLCMNLDSFISTTNLMLAFAVWSSRLGMYVDSFISTTNPMLAFAKDGFDLKSNLSIQLIIQVYFWPLYALRHV